MGSPLEPRIEFPNKDSFFVSTTNQLFFFKQMRKLFLLGNLGFEWKRRLSLKKRVLFFCGSQNGNFPNKSSFDPTDWSSHPSCHIPGSQHSRWLSSFGYPQITILMGKHGKTMINPNGSRNRADFQTTPYINMYINT